MRTFGHRNATPGKGSEWLDGEPDPDIKLGRPAKERGELVREERRCPVPWRRALGKSPDSPSDTLVTPARHQPATMVLDEEVDATSHLKSPSDELKTVHNFLIQYVYNTSLLRFQFFYPCYLHWVPRSTRSGGVPLGV